MHCKHWIEFTPTPLRQTAQGNAPELRRRSSPGPETMSFIFFILTLSPLRSIPSFHNFNLAMHSSSESAITAMSSARHTSTELARQSFRHKYEKQGAENRSLMHTNSNPELLAVLTVDTYTALTSVYMPWMTHTAHSSTPKLLKAHQRTFLGTLSKTFSRSTKAK